MYEVKKCKLSQTSNNEEDWKVNESKIVCKKVFEKSKKKEKKKDLTLREWG